MNLYLNDYDKKRTFSRTDKRHLDIIKVSLLIVVLNKNFLVIPTIVPLNSLLVHIYLDLIINSMPD